MNTALAKLNPIALRNLSAVSLHKVVQVVGLVVTVALVPRLFGAQDYGRFAFVLSLSYIGQILGDFGTLDVMGKFVPGMSRNVASRLYMQHLGFKLGVGLLCGLVTAIAALLLADWMLLTWAVLIGLGVYLHILAWVPYQFSLGLNRVGNWMSEQAWRQWVLLILLVALLPVLGLTGALLALLVMEVVFLALGLWLVRDYWQSQVLALDWGYLRPYIRFGLGFFAANLVAVTLYRSGPLLVEMLTGASTQTGYFNLALGLFMLAYITTGQFAQSLIPALSGFYHGGQIEAMRRWLKNFIWYGWFITWAGVLLVWLTADWAVPLVFGADFGPAAVSFKIISLAMPIAVILWAGSVVATVAGRGRLKFGASLAGLVLFGGADFLLVPLHGAAGASLALVLAITANTAILTTFLRAEFSRDWWFLAGTGTVGLMLVGATAWLIG